MIASKDAKVGVRVKWQSLDPSISPAFGSIVHITGKGEAIILCDDPDEDSGTCDSSTWLDSGASCWMLA